MLLLLFLASVWAQFRIIHGNQTMSAFSFLCSSKYGHPSHNLELVSLVVFARNGDRTPEKGKNKGWRKNMCVGCLGSTCQLIQCKNGMLTVKGYKQGHDLAGFIKKEYYPRFNKKVSYGKNRSHPFYDYLVPKGDELMDGTSDDIHADIAVHGYYYKAKKNYVFLKSVLGALDYSSLRLKAIDDLGCPRECLDLRNALFSKNDSEKLVAGGEFDRIIGSLCNEVPIECGKFGCDLMEMEEYLTQEKMNFEDNLVKMSEDIVPTAVSFRLLSEFILGVLPNRDISIVSVTAETIVTLLAGLNTDNSKLVPYAGAVFIELWRNKQGEEFYSVTYNGKRMKVGLFRENFVEKKEFEKFLRMFVKHSKQVSEICNFKPKAERNEDQAALKEDLLALKKEKVREVFSPLIKRLHEKRILVK